MLCMTYSSGGDERALSVWNTSSGSVITSFKDNSCQPHCLEASSDFVIAVQDIEKHGQHGFRQSIYVWNFEQVVFSYGPLLTHLPFRICHSCAFLLPLTILLNLSLA